MVNRQLILKLFEGFSIERWTDLVRPFDLIEMDKNAEKMVLAYIIGKFEEDKGNIIDWEWIIYASLFELLRKITLCDIKSPLQRRIKKDYPDEYHRLNEWIVSQYKDIITDNDLFNNFCDYIHKKDSPEHRETLTEKVFTAAHKYSAMREFQMLAVVNEDFRLKNIQRELNRDIQPYLELTGLQLLMTKQRPYEFLMILEQLRFQVRWNQTPRIPKTTVLGHSFFVAIITLLLSRESAQNYAHQTKKEFSFCSRRLYNNYFSALFHDLPEAVTRDIISPVKQATDGLSLIIKQIEAEILKNELRPLMEDFYADELLYFTDDEFENRILFDSPSGKILRNQISFEDLNEKYNTNIFSPIDGQLIRCADHISAFVEADSSINYGITSQQLTSGRKNLLKLYPEGHIINGFDPHAFFSTFL